MPKIAAILSLALLASAPLCNADTRKGALAIIKPITKIGPRPLEIGDAAEKKGWKEIPYEIADGVACIYNKDYHKHVGKVEFEVVEAGNVYTIGNWHHQGSGGSWEKERYKPEDFAKHGWKTLDKKLVEFNGKTKTIYYKYHSAGDRFKLRTNKYTPPFVIARIGSPGHSNVAKAEETAPSTFVVSTAAPAKAIEVKGSIKQVKALLVQELPSGGMAGFAQPLTITAVKDGADEPMSVAFNQDVGEMMQTALGAVVRGLQVRYGAWPRGYTAQLGFEEKYNPKDGPSAAVACALLIDGLITDADYDPGFAVTGDLNADLSVQPVGGVPAKIRGASKRGATIVAVPHGNRRSLADLVALGELAAFAKIQVFSIETFDQARDLARKDRPELLAAAIASFASLQKAGLSSMRTPESIAKLRQIVKSAPHHISAQVILLAATGKAPKKLSLAGSFNMIDECMGPFIDAIRAGKTETVADGQFADAMQRLGRMRTKLDPRAAPLHTALSDCIIFIRRNADKEYSNETQYVAAKKEGSLLVSRLDSERAKLASNSEVVEELSR